LIAVYTGPDGLRCPICGAARGAWSGTLAFYLQNGSAESELWRCPACRSWWRHFPVPVDLEAHFSVASYSDPEREEAWRAGRQPFFGRLVDRTLGTLQRPAGVIDVLDVGCAYGHLMEVFGARGCRVRGVEPVAAQRERIERRGRFCVFGSLQEAVDAGSRYDAVLAIDSLYYMPGPPAERLAELAALVKPGGVLVLRIANRSLYLSVMRIFGHPPGDADFGDALFCFSPRGMKILIGNAGLTIVSRQALEGKPVGKGDLRGLLLNRLLPLTAACTGLPVSPGLTYVCRKPQPA
jgi:SAM-dependent methyltransferase